VQIDVRGGDLSELSDELRRGDPLFPPGVVSDDVEDLDIRGVAVVIGLVDDAEPVAPLRFAVALKRRR
jgi:hypothetical protein